MQYSKPPGLKYKAKKETKPSVKQKKDHFANKENLWTEPQSQKKSTQTQEHKGRPLCNKNKTLDLTAK